MKIQVLNRKDFETFIPDSPAIAISITDPKTEKAKTKAQYLDILRLEFFDLDKDTGIFPYSKFTFSWGQAEEVLNFVNKHRGNVDVLVIHCEAGQSRSVGMAAALSLILNGHDSYYFKRYIPNRLVYRTILKRYYHGQEEK